MFHVKHYYDDSNAEFYILLIILMCFSVQVQHNASLKPLIYTVCCYNNRDIFLLLILFLLVILPKNIKILQINEKNEKIYT